MRRQKKYADRLSPEARKRVSEMIDRIMDLAMRRGLNQGDLEKACGFSTGRISKWKTQGQPGSEHLAKMAAALATSVQHLVTGKPSPGDLDHHDPYAHLIRMIDVLGLEESERRLMRADPEPHHEEPQQTKNGPITGHGPRPLIDPAAHRKRSGS